MISSVYVRTMARYNIWQNGSIYAAAGGLDEAARWLDRGAFFGSIQATLNHLLWADQIWLSRFAGTPKPQVSLSDALHRYRVWGELAQARTACDAAILEWADNLHDSWLAGDLTWMSGAAGRELTRPRALLVTHMFNHQTHHRGQVHAMLTAAGARPDDTDLMLMAEGVRAG
jgi:uncharacterized damage-inducible protein DinB